MKGYFGVVGYSLIMYKSSFLDDMSEWWFYVEKFNVLVFGSFLKVLMLYNLILGNYKLKLLSFCISFNCI